MFSNMNNSSLFTANNHQINQILTNYHENYGIHLQRRFVEELSSFCCDHYRSNKKSLTLHEFNHLLFNEILLSNFKHSVEAPAQMNNASLLTVQVDSAVNINQSEEFSHTVENSHRLLKLTLRCGNVTLVGYEYPYCSQLKLTNPNNVGYKITIHNVAITNGVIVLSPNNVKLLGGYAHELANTITPHSIPSAAVINQKVAKFDISWQEFQGEHKEERKSNNNNNNQSSNSNSILPRSNFISVSNSNLLSVNNNLSRIINPAAFQYAAVAEKNNNANHSTNNSNIISKNSNEDKSRSTVVDNSCLGSGSEEQFDSNFYSSMAIPYNTSSSNSTKQGSAEEMHDDEFNQIIQTQSNNYNSHNGKVQKNISVAKVTTDKSSFDPFDFDSSII
jgi:hypothetical protein